VTFTVRNRIGDAPGVRGRTVHDGRGAGAAGQRRDGDDVQFVDQAGA
jgi:hypothetical protein